MRWLLAAALSCRLCFALQPAREADLEIDESSECRCGARAGIRRTWHRQQERKQRGRLKVGFAVFVTDLKSQAWQDALAIMANSLAKAKAKSRHDITNLVLGPERLTDDMRDKLLSFGFDDVLRRPVPVPPEEMVDPNGRREMSAQQGTGEGLTFALA